MEPVITLKFKYLDLKCWLLIEEPLKEQYPVLAVKYYNLTYSSCISWMFKIYLNIILTKIFISRTLIFFLKRTETGAETKCFKIVGLFL